MDTTEVPSSSQERSPLQVWGRRIPAILFLGFVSFLFFKRHFVRAPERVDLSNLRLVDMDGAPLPVSLIQGKAVVLNYWAPWCPPCRVETPWLQHLQSAHAKDLVVIGVVADSEQYPQAKTFMQKEGVTYPIVRNTSSIESALGNVEGLPTTFYISSKGKVLHASSGLIPELLMQHYANDIIAN